MTSQDEAFGPLSISRWRRWVRSLTLRSPGLQATIAATLMLAGLTPLAVILALYLLVLEPRLQHGILKEHEQLALEVGAVLNRNLFERDSDVQAFALNPLAKDPAAWRVPDGPLVQAMNGYVRLYGMYRLTLLVSPQGQVLAVNSVDAGSRRLDTAPLYRRSVANEAWFTRLPYWTEGSRPAVAVSPAQKIPLVGELYRDDGHVVPFSAPVFGADGRLIAVWVNFFDFSKVGDIAQDMVDQRQRIQRSNQRFQVIDSNGALIHDSRPTAPYRVEAHVLDLLATRPPGAVAVSGVRDSEAIAAAPTPAKLGFKGLGWTALVREQTDVAFAPVLIIRRIVGGALVLTALAMLAFGLWYGHRLSGPILDLAERMRRLAAGDTASSVNHTERVDDIGHMAQAVAVFRQALIDKELGAARRTLAMEAADMGAWDFDLATGAIVWDERSLAIFAVPAGLNFDYLTFQTRLLEVDRERVGVLIQEALDPKGPGRLQTEYRVVGFDGVDRWISARGRSVVEDGVATRMIGTIVDVTDRKRAEAVLGESEARRALAMELAHIGAWETDVTDLTFRGDARSMELFGHPGETEIPYRAWRSALHPADAEAVVAAVTAAYDPNGTHAFEVEHRVVYPGEDRETWIAATGRVLFDGDRPIRMIGTMIDVTERRLAAAKLRESEERRLMAMEAAAIWSWEFNPRTRILNVPSGSSAFPPGLPGLGAIHYDAWLQTLNVSDRDPIEARVAAALDPSGSGAYEVEYRVTRGDGEERWVSAIGKAYFESGEAVRMIGTGMDVTERKQAELHRELLVNELNHRVKNSLATVQAIAQLTLTAQADPAEARASFIGRIIALARAHDVLTHRNWEWAELDELIDNVTASYRADNIDHFRIGGPSVHLCPKAALALSTALFELATNAAKYGALSAEGGRIDLHWTVAGDRFMLEWRESGGPPVAVPQKKGFGFRLIQHGLAAELGGEATTEYPVAGLRFRFEASLAVLRGSA